MDDYAVKAVTQRPRLRDQDEEFQHGPITVDEAVVHPVHRPRLLRLPQQETGG